MKLESEDFYNNELHGNNNNMSKGLNSKLGPLASEIKINELETKLTDYMSILILVHMLNKYVINFHEDLSN